MPELYKGRVPVIRNSLDEGWIRGMGEEAPSFGCIDRDYDVDPVLMGDSPDQMKLIDPSEYDARYDEQEVTESSLEHMYLRDGITPAFEFLDQDGFPDCWAHSTPHAYMLDRMKQNLPVVRFNGVAIATLLRQTGGGWCGLSMKFGRENGLPVVGTGPGQWPYQSRKGHDTPELRANMAKYKGLEDWYDMGKREWDQHLANAQLATCGLTNIPAPTDYNKYSHSMCMLRYVRIARGDWGKLTLNNWKGYGFHGLCVIADSAAKVSNAVALRSSSSSL